MRRFDSYSKTILIVMAVIFIISAAGQKSMAEDADPLTVVKKTVDDVLAVLRNEALKKPENIEERRKRIQEVVARRFDYREMSKQTLARYWKERTPEEKDAFVALFSKLLEKTYISKIESYSDEDIIVKEQLLKGNKAMVRTFIVKNGKEIPLYYKLKNKNGKWMIYGVVVEGVSLIRNYRTQFEDIINKENYAGLVKRIEGKLEKSETS